MAKLSFSPIRALLLSLLLLMTNFSLSEAAKEGFFGLPDRYNGSKLSKFGVRTKGPIKVYAVGQYGQKSFLLKMTYGVNAQKMASALKDALKPRCNDAKKVDEFETLMLSGLPNGAPKGTTLGFGTSDGKLSLEVNGKSVGTIGSSSLAKGFAGIYTDSKAVCSMKTIQ